MASATLVVKLLVGGERCSENITARMGWASFEVALLSKKGLSLSEKFVCGRYTIRRTTWQ